ncbi:MAG: 50S ribosomal protein L13 [Fervidobacterium sp.]|uniref:Large ribosomal subunit protein uL13 n=1 Tax=Fervidobacterium gondwanense DSM 13020 TaxID=1121883 RepID=A0A1M7RRG6_FERGO|nr:50S ribosomal protein L13 [Fervidobacterium gondwanense]UXF00370.1 50S ribosomal protein L13 [Fervidobacterium riparium]SHN48696.1 LSU ribosomal protein L13P [Fervidobacterium gondwanense DSM 13020]
MARPLPIQKTAFPKVERKWYLVDAADKPLGRLATRIALLLQGKNEPTWAPHLDNGNYVVVINADKVKLTGKKVNQKVYYHHSGYPGGLKAQTARQLLEKHPERVIELAVKRMLPKTVVGTHQFKRLKVYAGENHPHEAQKPEKVELL